MKDIIYEQTIHNIDIMYNVISQVSQRDKAQWGEIAMEKISDYPLYASTDGITYEQAILVAMVIFGDFINNKEGE